jgi:hypothetical protein
LWGFNISNATDDLGQVVKVDPNAYTTGFSSHPQKFLCNITPRHAGVDSIVKEQAEQYQLPKTTGIGA